MGQKKPVEVKEEKPIDLTPMTNHMDNLNKREEQLLKKIGDIDQQLATLKQQMAQGGSGYSVLRMRASNLLKQKNMYMKQLQSVSTMNLTVGQTMSTIEGIQLMKDQYDLMKDVSNAQSEMFKSVNLNDYMALSDKMQDMREDMDDVQEMLMDGMAGDVELDEEELDRELASIQMGALPSSTTATPAQAYPVQQQPAAEVPMPMAATTTNNWRDELNNL